MLERLRALLGPALDSKAVQGLGFRVQGLVFGA